MGAGQQEDGCASIATTSSKGGIFHGHQQLRSHCHTQITVSSANWCVGVNKKMAAQALLQHAAEEAALIDISN